MDTTLCSLQDTNWHAVTLLLSNNLEVLLDEFLPKFGGKTNNFLKYLLIRHSSDKFNIHNEKFATGYQKQGQKLKPKHFRTDPVVWHSLKLFARFHGISMCLAFALLCLRELEQNVIVPTNSEILEPMEKIESCRFVEILTLKENHTQRTIAYKKCHSSDGS